MNQKKHIQYKLHVDCAPGEIQTLNALLQGVNLLWPNAHLIAVGNV